MDNALGLGSLLSMDSAFMLEVVSYLAVFPAVIMCLLPMHKQLKCSMGAALVRFILLGIVVIPLAAYANVRFGLDTNTLTIPLVLLFLIVFHLHVKASPTCSFAIVIFVCALMSILANYANAYDAMIRPGASADTFSMQAALFQLGINVATLAVLGWFLWSFGAEIVEKLENDSVWSVTILVSAVVLAFNIMLIPADYDALRNPRELTKYLVMLSLLFLLLLLTAGTFYFSVTETVDKHRMENRNRMLEVQESQYRRQSRYLEATARTRHDFRQTIRTLKALSDAGEYEKLDEYLSNYVESMPENDVVQYCRNNAVNALLNFYARAAGPEGVDLNLSVDLPEQLSVDDVDLCTMLGNILENALIAAKDAPEGKRWIDLVVTTQFGVQLLIVATNGMAGNLKVRNGTYLSTTHQGAGIGLNSIRSTATRYGGVAEFSNTADEFRTDVMIPLA